MISDILFYSSWTVADDDDVEVCMYIEYNSCTEKSEQSKMCPNKNLIHAKSLP